MNLRDLFLRIRALVARHRVERELDEELAFHIERETQEHIAAGLSSVDARTRALARFGPVPLAADGCRDARGIGLVDDLPGDIRYALRTYFNVLGVEVVSGRNFTQAERTADAGVAIVSETIARQLWPNGDGVGQEVRLEAPPSAPPGATPLSAEARSAKAELLSRTLTVVGVVRNPGRDSGSVYVPTSPETPETALFLRVRGNPEQARQVLLERLSSIDPALMNVMTLRALTGMQAYALQIGFWVAVVLGGLALVLTVSGLFRVLSYVVEQRAKEIGVRMALGAATKHVAQLVLSQSLVPVGSGLAAGGGLAAAVAIVLMATPAAFEIGGVIDVFDPVAYVASALVIGTACLIAVSVPTLRAARIDPMAILRKD